jgi:hypothetical protein
MVIAPAKHRRPARRAERRIVHLVVNQAPARDSVDIGRRNEPPVSSSPPETQVVDLYDQDVWSASWWFDRLGKSDFESL